MPASGPMYIVFHLLPLMVVWVLFVWFRFFGSLRKKRDEDNTSVACANHAHERPHSQSLSGTVDALNAP